MGENKTRPKDTFDSRIKFAATTPLQNTRCMYIACTRLELRYRTEARCGFSTAVTFRPHCRYTITEVYLHEFSARHYIEEGHHHTGGTHRQSGRPCPGSKSNCPISTNALKPSGSALRTWPQQKKYVLFTQSPAKYRVQWLPQQHSVTRLCNRECVFSVR